MTDIKSKIKDIVNNNSLSSSQKNTLIQSLYTPYNISSSTNNICEHYPSKYCDNFYFSCCNIFTNCLRCHNDFDNTHKPILQFIRCTKCKLLQNPSNKCINNNCLSSFSKYYCHFCHIWTHKPITHCSSCGICRIGHPNSLFHCDNCQICFDISSKNSHICVNSFRDQSCSFCLEPTHNSQYSSLSINCGHFVHKICLDNAFKSNIFKCSICRKSIFKVDWSFLKYLISSQPMPIDDISVDDIVSCSSLGNIPFHVTNIINIHNTILYHGFFPNWTNYNGTFVFATFNKLALFKSPKNVNIFCNDCDTKSFTPFHYLGNECFNCNSFNTSIL